LHPRPDAVRNRVFTLMDERRLGGRDTVSVRKLAKLSEVAYTTLARFLLSSDTDELRKQSLARVARALDSTPEWIRDGQGTKQLGLWPAPYAGRDEAQEGHPLKQVSEVMECIAGLPANIQVRVARAAVAAVVEVLVGAGEAVDPGAYQCLRRLDSLHRPSVLRKVGANA
jgi:hypothetical protein